MNKSNKYFYIFRYAGSIYGITNTISTLPGILAPIVVGEITAEVSLRL